MKIKKIKNLSRNMLYGLIYRMISIIGPFIIRTIIINVLSTEYLGLSSLFTSILQALSLVELGIGSALVFNMYDPVAKNDNKKLGAYLNFYKKCYRIIGVVILLLGLMVLPFLDKIINGTYPKNINIYVLYIIYLINTVLTYWLFAYKNSIALAYQRTDIENKSLICSQLLMYIFQIVVLFEFKNYYYYVVALPIFTILKNILVSYRIDKEYSKIEISGILDKEEKIKVLSNVKFLFGHQIAFTVINSVDSIVISMVLGLNDLAIYNNYYYIFSALVNILTILFSSIQAGIGNDIIVSSKETMFNNFKKFRLWIYIIINAISMFLFTLYQPFMKIWMGEKLLLSDTAVILFVIGFYVTQIRKVVTTYKNAAGMWKEDGLKPYIMILVDLVIDIILIKYIGSIGAMVATIISIGLVAIPWETYVLYKKLFKENVSEHFKFMIKESIIFVVNIILLKIIMDKFNFTGILGIVIIFIITLCVTLVITIITNCKNEFFNWGIQRVKLIIKNKE